MSTKPLRWRRQSTSVAEARRAGSSDSKPWLDDTWCRRHGEQEDAGAAFLRTQACHVRGLFEEGLYTTLLAEAEGVEAWSTHAKAERWGPAAEAIFEKLEATFGMRAVAGRRFNVYRHGEGKPLHQDLSLIHI